MKILFLGTPEFSVKVLEIILKSKHEIVGVVTQPDKVNGRGNKVSYSPMKEYAYENNIKVYQFERISKEIEVLKSIDCDIMLTCAYGQILSEEVLTCKKYGVINVHASLLPKYRGASPVQSAIIDGEEELGVTIMQTALKVDSGDILVQDKMKMNNDENYAEALLKLSKLGGELSVKALNLLESGDAKFTKQDESEVTFCKLYKKEDGKISFEKTAKELNNFIRGMNPWPSAYIESPLGKLKIIKAEPIEGYNNGQTGEILVSEPKKGLIIKCKEGAISVLNLQAENGKAMDITPFLLGKKLEKGLILHG